MPDVGRLFRDVWLDPLVRWDWPVVRSAGVPASNADAVCPPSVDLYETDTELVAKVELPGIRKDEVELRREDGHLLIRGEHREAEEPEEGCYYRCERFRGPFERLIHLPVPVDEEKITAKFEDGILEIRAPKTEEASEPAGARIEIA